MVNQDYFKFKQSMVEAISILCMAILFIFLFAMVVFIGLQGARYFLPSAVHSVTLSYPQSLQEEYYEISYLSAEELAQEYQTRFQKQFRFENANIPQVSVRTEADVVHLKTHLGESILGKVRTLTSPESNTLNLENLDDLLATTELLKSELGEVQSTILQPLHQDIATLLQQDVAKDSPALQEKYQQFSRWQTYSNSIDQQLAAYTIELVDSHGNLRQVPLASMESIIFPNDLGFFDGIYITFSKMMAFLAQTPKQGATSGGVFPAIFGTVLMVLLMTLVVAPFGIIAAIYLHEYAPDNKTTALIRIGISNMAAVPSVVYGVFGLGFFVYTLGGSLDTLLFDDNLPSPTFGTPGLLWASLTMGLLTLPVVIVSAEEGLRRIPQGLREGSYALGATKLETIQKVVLPMASPGLLTGIILAIARAAGEVAPLILVGAVKFAPNLPVDGEFPFLHLERQFMHLGVFIYDGAFHNQLDSQTSSMMFASCMLLLVIVFLLNITAVIVRKRLRDKYERNQK
ncbi:phosphate ABC transporter permease PstA [Glaciecola sp. 1036]|uniref:phosphate ABC transporter permease PstA n=1 Tax=Alteromonadaceae TaxID=72275 RepID=UPI003D0462FE